MENLKQALQDEWEVTPLNGFLPKRDPLIKLPAQYQDLECICANLQSLIPQQKIAYYVENHLQDHTDSIKVITDDVPLLIALFRDYCFLSSAYLLEDCHADYKITRNYGQARSVLPKIIAVPLQYLCQLQGGKPWIDYHRSYVLYNFQRKNPNGAVHYDNIKTIRTFTANPGEPGFILTHTSIAGHSPKIIGHIESIFVYLQKNQRSKINDELKALCTQFVSIKDEMRQMYTRNSIESFFEFRTFITGSMGTPMFKKGVIYEGHSDQPEYVRGPSGALDLTMPTIDRFFGLAELFPQNALTNLLAEYKQHIPEQHQLYIKRIESLTKRLSFVEYILKDSKSLLCFLKCLYNIVLFRQTHYNFVKEYVIKREKIAIGTGGSDATAFVSNQLIVLYDYFTSLCDKITQCETSNKRDQIEIQNFKINVLEKKELFIATLEALKKSLSNDYDSILHSNLSPTYESAMILQKNDKLAYIKDQFYLPSKKCYFPNEKNEILSKKVEQALNNFLQIWKSSTNASEQSTNQNSLVFNQSNENESMSPCVYASMAMNQSNNKNGTPSFTNLPTQNSLRNITQNNNSPQGCLKTQLSNIHEKLSHMISCYEQEIGLTPSVQVAIYQILSAFLKAQLATKEKILIIQNSSSSPLILKHVKQWLQRYYPEMNEQHVIGVFTIPDSDSINQQQVQEMVMKQIEEHQYNTALMIMTFSTAFIDNYINIPQVSKACNQYNIYFVLDSIASFSNTPLKLHDWNVDASIFQPSNLYTMGGIFIHEKHKDKDQFFSNWLDKEAQEKKVIKTVASAESLETLSENSEDLDSDCGDDDEQEDLVFDKECRSLKRFDVTRYEKLQIIQLNAQYDYIIEAGINNMSRKMKDMIDYLSYLFRDISILKVDNFSKNFTNVFAFKIDKSQASITTKKLYEFLNDNNVKSEYSKKTGQIKIHLNSFYNHFTDCHELFNLTKGIISEYL